MKHFILKSTACFLRQVAIADVKYHLEASLYRREINEGADQLFLAVSKTETAFMASIVRMISSLFFFLKEYMNGYRTVTKKA